MPKGGANKIGQAGNDDRRPERYPARGIKERASKRRDSGADSGRKTSPNQGCWPFRRKVGVMLRRPPRKGPKRGWRSATLDCNIYVSSERAGLRVMESVTHFITYRLKLKVNQAKSAVARPWQRKFLGFSFTHEREPRRRISPKAIARFKERIREQTRRTRGISLAQMGQQITTYLRGWLGYFGDSQTPSVLQTLEGWLRRRLRSMVWKQWKQGRTRFRELRKRNVSTDLAAQTAGSPHGPWHRKLARPGHRSAECLLCPARTSAHGRAVLA